MENPERVAFFLPSLAGGGAQRVAVNLANGFAARGYQVDLVLAQAKGPFLSHVSEDVRVVDLTSSRVLYSTRGLFRYLRSNRPSAIISSMTHANLFAALLTTVGIRDTKCILVEHSHVSPSIPPQTGLRERIVLLLARFLYPLADRIVAVSEGASKDLAAFLGKPSTSVTWIYNPIFDASLGEDAGTPIPHGWLEREAAPVILNVGRLEEIKDHPTLLHAFAKIRARREARLVILGDGERRSELQALSEELGVTDDVLLPGFVTDPYAWMRECAVFVLSSRSESFGNVLVEAMACGASVVSTDCPSGPAEILGNGKWGRLVPVGDADAMAEAIEDAIEAGAPPEGSLDRARDFGVDTAVDAYIELIGSPNS